MPTPKHKIQRYRRDNRRAHQALEASSFVKCPRCNQEKRSHHACMNCGFYKDLNVLKLEA